MTKKTIINLLIICTLVACGINEEMSNADFRVSGQVVDKATGKAIENIQINLKNRKMGVFSRTLTNAQGAFWIEAGNGGYTIDSVNVVAIDIDSTENGFYESDSTWVFLQSSGSGFSHEPAAADGIFFSLNKKQ